MPEGGKTSDQRELLQYVTTLNVHTHSYSHTRALVRSHVRLQSEGG